MDMLPAGTYVRVTEKWDGARPPYIGRAFPSWVEEISEPEATVVPQTVDG